MPFCKVCQQQVPKLIRCHIYPDSMTREIASDGLVAMSTVNGPRAAYAHAGLFDDNLACLACEMRFGPADDYAIRFRRAVLTWGMPYEIRYGTLRLPTFQADAGLLHSFAVNVLFRSHLSDRPEHRQTNSEVIDAEAREALRTGRSTIESGRQIAIVATTGNLGGMISSPHIKLNGDHPLYLIQMPHISFMVAASDAQLNPEWHGITLKPGQPVTIWRRRRPERFELEVANKMFGMVGDRVDRMFNALRKTKGWK
jgi:hypothetical protein